MRVPWVVNVDSGYLWIQEYPVPQPDYTINGAFFAIAGIANYAITFSDHRATHIADGAMTTMLHYVSQVRNPGWISSYSLTHKEDESAHYHGIVTRQLALMYTITRDRRFANVAAQFISDYPDPKVMGKIALSPGIYTLGQTEENDGWIASTTQVTIDSATEVAVALRVKMRNVNDYWYEIVSGPYTGSWIEESKTLHLSGPVNEVYFSPPMPFTLSGTYQLYTFQQGNLQAAGTMKADSSQSVLLGKHATINTVDVWQISSGQYAGDYIAGAMPTIVA
jgi:hypothetical protein